MLTVISCVTRWRCLPHPVPHGAAYRTEGEAASAFHQSSSKTETSHTRSAVRPQYRGDLNGEVTACDREMWLSCAWLNMDRF